MENERVLCVFYECGLYLPKDDNPPDECPGCGAPRETEKEVHKSSVLR